MTNATTLCRSIAAVLVLLLSPIACETAALAQVGPTTIISGPGGANFSEQCPGDGEFLIGINFVKYNTVNAVAGVCGYFNDAGQERGGEDGLAVYGDPNIDGRSHYEHSIRCPKDTAAEKIDVEISSTKFVFQFYLICRNPFDHVYKNSGSAGPEYTTPIASGTPGCGGGALAVGLIGRYGSSVDGLGLLCKIIAVAPPPPPPGNFKPITHLKITPTTPAAPITQTQPPDDGNGGGATAATDTTIYDQPEGNDVAYLQAGDSVTIVTCGANNWCQISKPKKGWVWGDDLNR